MGLYDFPYRNLDDKKRVSKLCSNFKTLPNPNKRNVKGQYSFFFFVVVHLYLAIICLIFHVADIFISFLL